LGLRCFVAGAAMSSLHYVLLLVVVLFVCTPGNALARKRRHSSQSAGGSALTDDGSASRRHGHPHRITAADLTSQSTSPFTMQSGSTLINNGESQSDLITDRPLTLPATPLEAPGSFSGSSSVHGMGSGSSGRSRSSLTGSFEADDCNSDGPCGGGAPTDAKLVHKLTGGGKKFKRNIGKGIWTFGGDNGKSEALPDGVSRAEVEKLESDDPEIAKLYHQLQHLKARMAKEQNWVKVVAHFIKQYQAKAGSVAAGLRAESNQVKALRAAIQARKKMAARKVLQERLKLVTGKLHELQAATSNVSGEAKNLMALKKNLHQSIHGLQSEILKLARTK